MTSAIAHTLSDTGRMVWAEHYKARKTRIYLTAILPPLLICGLIFLMLTTMSTKDITALVAKNGPIWTFARIVSTSLYTGLMLPIQVALLASQLNGLEHNRNTWKVLLALPVTRTSVYWAKALFLVFLVGLSQLALLLGVWGTVHLAMALRPAIPVADTPWSGMAMGALAVGMASLVLVAIHHLLAIRVKGVGVSMGVAIGGLVTASLLMQGWEHVAYFPYAQPMLTGIQHIGPVTDFWIRPMWVAAVSGIALLGLGAWLLPKRLPS